jgi:uncharacterized protein (TIGR02001 family)
LPGGSPPADDKPIAAAARRAAFCAGMVASLAVATPARAQVAGSVDLQTDYRVRGYSLSAGHPTAAARIGYDDASGFYLNALAIGEWSGDHPRFLGVQGNIGYAKRLTRTLTIDGGVLRTDYRPDYPFRRERGYTEFYAGLSGGGISGHVYVSPAYYRPGITTVYGELQGTIEPIAKWRLGAHVGLLNYVATPPGYRGRTHWYDWRLSLTRQIRAIELQAALSGGGPGQDFYAGRGHDRAAALTAGISWSF